MSVTVQLRYLRHSAKKIRPLTRIFKGKNLDVALNMTAVMSTDSAKFVHKALKMAQASAEAKEFTPATMIIGEIFATEGPKIKRMRPNARGRGNSYQKHLAHLTVTLAEAKEPKKAVKKPAAKAKPVKEDAVVSEMKNISDTRSQKGDL